MPDGTTLRPDLIFHNCLRAVIVDVTVRYETERADVFEKAYQEKRSKYQPVAAVMIEREGLTAVTVLGLVLGCRGAYPNLNDDVLEDLGICTKRVKTVLARRAILGTLDMLRHLGDSPNSWVNVDD